MPRATSAPSRVNVEKKNPTLPNDVISKIVEKVSDGQAKRSLRLASKDTRNMVDQAHPVKYNPNTLRQFATSLRTQRYISNLQQYVRYDGTHQDGYAEWFRALVVDSLSKHMDPIAGIKIYIDFLIDNDELYLHWNLKDVCTNTYYNYLYTLNVFTKHVNAQDRRTTCESIIYQLIKKAIKNAHKFLTSNNYDYDDDDDPKSFLHFHMIGFLLSYFASRWSPQALNTYTEWSSLHAIDYGMLVEQFDNTNEHTKLILQHLKYWTPYLCEKFPNSMDTNDLSWEDGNLYSEYINLLTTRTNIPLKKGRAKSA